jgi:hypothetical protein
MHVIGARRIGFGLVAAAVCMLAMLSANSWHDPPNLAPMATSRMAPDTADTRARYSSASSGSTEAGDDADDDITLEQILRDTVGAVPAPHEYWRDESAERHAYTEALITAQTQARALLTGRFGTAASDAWAFRALFRPLDRRFPFLTSGQQIVIHNAELRFGASLDSGDPETSATGFLALLQRLETMLGADVAFEYGVRASPLSRQMRASGVSFDELEFRETYALLASLDRGEPAPGAYRDVRRALRSLLGSARFNALWASRDPRFQALEEVGKRHALGDDVLMSAYAIINDTQDVLLDASLGASGDEQVDARRLRSLYDSSRARLADVVGADAARAILTTLSLPPSSRAKRELAPTTPDR